MPSLSIFIFWSLFLLFVSFLNYCWKSFWYSEHRWCWKQSPLCPVHQACLCSWAPSDTSSLCSTLSLWNCSFPCLDHKPSRPSRGGAVTCQRASPASPIQVSQSLFFLFFLFTMLIYNMVLVSSVQQSDSDIYIYIYILFQTLFSYRLLQNIK